MAKVYTYLYSAENLLRLFIEETCKKVYNENYFNQITTTRALQKTISGRKENNRKING